MQEELYRFKENKEHELVLRPEDHPVISAKWVYRNKLDDEGTMVRNKTRLVTKGYPQQKGIHCDETQALMARFEAVRLLLAYTGFYIDNHQKDGMYT